MLFSKRNNIVKFFSWLVVLFIFVMLAAIILVQKDSYMKNTIIIRQLKKEFLKLKEENKKINIELAKYQKLEDIEQKALENLYMHYPKKVVFLNKGDTFDR